MIEVRNIGFGIKHLSILNEVSFGVKPGEVVVIIGSNGAGKSTLLKIVAGALKTDRGTVHIAGKQNKDWPAAQLAKRLAVMHQQTVLTLPFMVHEVVMMGRYPHFKNNPSPADKDIVTEALKQAGIRHLAERNYMLLSGGEQQRVHLARVFAQVWPDETAKDTSYLFMDEPSNNLDVRHQHNILSMAREFASAGNCVIAVLHDLNLAMQYADKILLLQKGNVLGFGTPAEVMNEPLMTKAYDFPVHILQHSAYGFPIVMPAAPEINRSVL
jgi:iron complex transport system ATP-binding protein